MALACRNCKERFDLRKFLTDSNTLPQGYSVVSTQCGHLFHLKCLEGALTNQKLLHMRHGTGPLRRFCPVPRCNAEIPSEDSLIKISFPDETNTQYQEDERNPQDVEGKLMKRVQMLTAEREKLLESIERADNEAEMLRSALDEIKFDLSDIQSFLKDDHLIKKGDLIFWVTKDGTYAPGKVMEIRKKPAENIHYGIVKLENKTRVAGIGPHPVERDTLILPITELTTFKSFFKEFFDKFQAKFDLIIVDLNAEIQEMTSPIRLPSDRSTTYYRSTRKLSRSVSKSYIASLDSLDEMSSVSVEGVPVTAVRKSSLSSPGIKSTQITRSRTIHYGAGSEPRRLEKCRSMSWATAPSAALNTLDSPMSESGRSNRSFQDLCSTTTEEAENEDEYPEEEVHNEFIREGETVIWYDTYSKYEQVGTVAAVFEHSPCAIVKFEEHPVVKHQFQYRTIQVDELFPYDLASPEDKFKIAEAYGNVGEFIESRAHLFNLSNEESTSENGQDDELGDTSA